MRRTRSATRPIPQPCPRFAAVPSKKRRPDPDTLSGPALLKACNRRIRTAMQLWDAHRNAACRGERKKALALYERLTPKQRDDVPQELRVWLRYRSEKYFGEGRAGNGANSGSGKRKRGQASAKTDAATGPPEADGPDDGSWDDW